MLNYGFRAAQGKRGSSISWLKHGKRMGISQLREMKLFKVLQVTCYD